MQNKQRAKTRLSEAAIWELHEEYYAAQGISAWNVIPYQSTSNSYIAEAYVEQLMAFLQDYLEHIDFAEPLYILELGAGTGCFSHNFIRAFSSKCTYFSGLKSLRWNYLITDIVGKNIHYWQNNGAFDEAVAAGKADFALFNPEKDGTIKLERSGKVLRKGDFKNPLIVIANYFFDSLRVDEFRVTNGMLEETLVEFEFDSTRRFDFQEFRRTSSCRPVSGNYYGHPVLDGILEEYRTLFSEASILFPISSFRVLENLKHLSGNQLFLISTDKGFNYPEYMHGHWDQTYTSHGSFSYMVNYDAIRRYFKKNHGELLCTADPDIDLLLNAGCILDVPTGNLEATRFYFEEKMSKQNLVNYLPALLEDSASVKNTALRPLKEFRAAVQMTNYDAVTFDKYAAKLLAYLDDNTPSRQQVVQLRTLLERVEANCYPSEGSGAPIWLGILYYKLQEYGRCADTMEKALAAFGTNFYACYYIASCCELHSQQYDKALLYFKEALKLDPANEDTIAAIKRISEIRG